MTYVHILNGWKLGKKFRFILTAQQIDCRSPSFGGNLESIANPPNRHDVIRIGCNFLAQIPDMNINVTVDNVDAFANNFRQEILWR